MAPEVFHEIYRKLAVGRGEPQKAFGAIDELAQACRNAPDEWLSRAKNCIHEIAKSPDLFVVAVATWTTQPEDFALARALIHESSVRHLDQSTALSYDLAGLSEAKAILAGCRLCSFYVAPAVSLGWALSLSNSFPDSATTEHAVHQLLEYHANEFPRSTLKMLSATDSPFAEVGAAADALAWLIEDEVQLKCLPRLREFAMTPEMRLSLSSLRRRQDREMHQHANDQSVFMQICKVDRFKYANRTAVEIGVGAGVHETPTAMSPYSLAVEIPISESTDPQLGAANRRRMFGGIPQ